MQLAQPCVDHGRQSEGAAERGGRVDGAGQVAGEQDGRRERLEPGPGRGGLRAAEVIQWGVEVALDAAGGVVGGATVAQQDDPTAQDVFRPAERSTSRSVNSITGQSFQSRSRA